MQKKLSQGNLLNQFGHLCESGYATELIKDYKRSDIKAKSWRIKEWDYYYIGNDTYGIAFTIADNSYMGLISVTFFDFVTPSLHSKSWMTWFPMGKLHLPESSKKGDITFHNNQMHLSFINNGKKRILKCQITQFQNQDSLSCDLELYDEPKESMCIATPFEKPTHFYYNQKINNIKVKGNLFIGNRQFDLSNAQAVLDWGRGVWTYKNTWYWASLSTLVGEHRVGFNLGYGFGDTSAATENMIFYDGIAEKVDQVIFHIPIKENNKRHYMGEWTCISNDGKIDLTFTPVIDRYANTSLGIIASCQHQVFGRFNGYLKWKDQIITLKDKLGFAEEVRNKW